MREVDVDLYEFLKKHETELSCEFRNNKVVAYVDIPFEDLDEFQEIVGYHRFRDGLGAILQTDSVRVEIQDIIKEDHELENYQMCFKKEDWNIAFG